MTTYRTFWEITQSLSNDHGRETGDDEDSKNRLHFGLDEESVIDLGSQRSMKGNFLDE